MFCYSVAKINFSQKQDRILIAVFVVLLLEQYVVLTDIFAVRVSFFYFPAESTGHWGLGPLWNERGGARGWQEVWGWWHWEGKLGHSGKDPKEPKTRPPECKIYFG